jgi:aminopeptidase-like protein
MKEYFKRLFPVNRSLTGEGVDETFRILQEMCAFDIHGVRSGTKIFDWTIPKVWNVKEAYIEGLVDFKNNNLHLVGYSRPFRGILTNKELKSHLHMHPVAIPYKTSYYEDNWGFCLKEQKLDNKKYKVVVDTTLKDGYMRYGLKRYKGVSNRTYLFSTYSCHPSMSNDNMSGMLMWAKLNDWLSKRKTYHNYEFLIAPETIGMLTYLKRHKPKLDGAFVLTCVGGNGFISKKDTFEKTGYIDSLFDNETLIRYPFEPVGSDERQLSSPAFRIPTTSLFAGKYYEYDEYHTSADNKIDWRNFNKIFRIYKKVIKQLEKDRFYTSTVSGEPMLGKRKLYNRKVIDIMFNADGKTPISKNKTVDRLVKEGLLI